MNNYWCEAAWLGGAEPEARVRISTVDGLITSVVSGVDPQANDTRLDGLVLPGFANAHSHVFHRLIRGRTHAGQGDFWAWREAMYQAATTIDPDSMYAIARATYAEMLEAGYTSVGEFHYLHNAPDGSCYADPQAMERAVIRAATDAGIRLTLLDTCYLHGGFDQDVEGVQVRFSDGSVDTWAHRVEVLWGSVRDNQMVKIGAAAHSVRALNQSELADVASVARGLDLVAHAHCSEQLLEVEDCLAHTEVTPLTLLEEAGLVHEKSTLVHGNHFSDGDVNDVAMSGAAVCVCRTTERDLGDGPSRAADIDTLGGRLCIGSDSQAVIDPFVETAAIELDERSAKMRRGVLSARALIEAATVIGTNALGWPSSGISEGSVADLVCVNLESSRLAGLSFESLLGGALLGGTASDVTDVVVNGEQVVVDARHRSVDVGAELTDVVGKLLP